MAAILELQNIRLSLTNSRGERYELLRGVDLAVEKGGVTALVGGNGTGKTTLFNIISGFQPAYRGDIRFEGHSLNRMPAHRISQRGIGRLFQGGQLLAGLSLMENMKAASCNHCGEAPFSTFVHPRRYRRAELRKEQQASDILTRLFGPDSKYLGMLDHDASSFSYGEQRLLSLARLLMDDNRLLLLDEPTAGVNPLYIDNIERIIREMVSEGMTVLLIEHNMHFVRRVADSCAYLDDGVIAKTGPTQSVLDDEEVRNSYLGL